MKYLKLFILLLILLNFPSYALININVLTGTILSYVTFILILVYYFFNKKEKLIVPFIVLGLLYFLISLLVDSQNSENFIIIFIKYFILIIGAKLIVDSRDIEINIILLIGALSIVYESIFIIDIGGRYSGFYLNPNSAGFACLIGFSFSMFNKDKKIKVLGQILFSIAGFVTLSRTFLLLWVLINIISLSISYKNSYKILAGVLLFSAFISLEDKFDFQIKRIEAFSSILDGVYSDVLDEDSRLATWSDYYNRIYASPLFGNGFKSFSGITYGTGENSYSIQGVHNTFLMILGEAGFFVFIFFTWIYCGFIARGIKLFKEDPLIFFVSFLLFSYMLTNHNFFDNYLVLFVSLWLYIQIGRKEITVDKKTIKLI